jgi:hypothetical protein
LFVDEPVERNDLETLTTRHVEVIHTVQARIEEYRYTEPTSMPLVIHGHGEQRVLTYVILLLTTL